MKKANSLLELTTFLNLFITADNRLDFVGVRDIKTIEGIIRALIPDFLEKGMEVDYARQQIRFHAPEEGDSVPLLGIIKCVLNEGSELNTIKEFKFIK